RAPDGAVIAELGFTPGLIASNARGDFVASAAAGRVVRFDAHSGRRVETTLRDAPISLVIGEDLVWIAAGGALWRWDGATAPVLTEVPRPVVAIATSAAGVIARTAAGVFLADVVPPRLVTNGAVRDLALLGDRAIITSPQG